MPITDNLNVTDIVPYAGEVTRTGYCANKVGILETGTVEFGLAVVVGSAEGTVAVPTGTGLRLAGITVRPDGAIENFDNGDPVAYSAALYPDVTYTDFAEGIAVQTNEQVAAGDPVFFVHSGADAGKFRTDATTADAVANAIFVKAYSATRAEVQLRKVPV